MIRKGGVRGRGRSGFKISVRIGVAFLFRLVLVLICLGFIGGDRGLGFEWGVVI